MFYLNRKEAVTQTDTKYCDEQETQDNNYQISISIKGSTLSKEKEEDIKQILYNINLKNEIHEKLRDQSPKRKKPKSYNKKDISPQPDKQGEMKKTIFSAYDYYHKKFVANRIKKYHFNKPDSIVLNCVKAK